MIRVEIFDLRRFCMRWCSAPIVLGEYSARAMVKTGSVINTMVWHNPVSSEDIILAKGAAVLSMTLCGGALLLVENYSNSRRVRTVSFRAIFALPLWLRSGK